MLMYQRASPAVIVWRNFSALPSRRDTVTSWTVPPKAGPGPSGVALAARIRTRKMIVRVRAKAKKADRKLGSRQKRWAVDLTETNSTIVKAFNEPAFGERQSRIQVTKRDAF